MRRERETLPKPFDFEQLRFQQVEVAANGITYRGILIGADDEDLYLKGSTRWIILPMYQVRDVRSADTVLELDGRKQVSADFYKDDLDPDE